MEMKTFTFKASDELIKHIEKKAKSQKDKRLHKPSTFVRELIKKTTKFKEPKIEIL